jgi:hypothetical protein
MNPFAGGGSNNLYRCFIDLSFRLVAPQGNAALIHQDGHLGDPKSGPFRRHWYARIVKHFGYINTIKSKNFADAAHYMRFSQNIYRGIENAPAFEQFTTAFLAQQIEDSYGHDGVGEVPDIKGKDGKWDTRGHRDRVINIDQESLAVIHALSEEDAIPVEEARFIQPFSARTLDVFRQMAHFPKLDTAVPKINRVSSIPSDERSAETPLWHMSAHWHEAGAQKDGTIERETAFRDLSSSILQGPHLHVGNPFYKTPRRICTKKGDYDVLDHASLPEDYVPRTNYRPAVSPDEFIKRTTRCRWDHTKLHSDFFRIAFRGMINLNSERSLIGAIIPKKMTHNNGVLSVAFADERLLLNSSAQFSSLPLDFLIKISGKQNFQPNDLAGMPWVDLPDAALHRSLRLSCLTSAYAELWNLHAPTLDILPWSSLDPRLHLEGTVGGPATWDRTAGLRTEFARRMALVEIDVLVAQAIGLSLDQLLEIYRIYFPILQQYEDGTWFDQNGRIVWTCSKGLPGVGWLDDRGKSPGRAAWERILVDNPAELTCTAIDDTMPGGPRTITRHFVGPFTQCDRIEDYRRAWGHFERLKCEEAA